MYCPCVKRLVTRCVHTHAKHLTLHSQLLRYSSDIKDPDFVAVWLQHYGKEKEKKKQALMSLSKTGEFYSAVIYVFV